MKDKIYKTGVKLTKTKSPDKLNYRLFNPAGRLVAAFSESFTAKAFAEQIDGEYELDNAVKSGEIS